jgi:DNA invertase Pin-like site-specific DNA recombinase
MVIATPLKNHKVKEFNSWQMLLTKENQRHICGASMVPVAESSKQTKKRRKLTDQDKLKIYILSEQGMSQTKIADRLNVGKQTVSNVLKNKGNKGTRVIV